jgi:hypothetical protein
MVIHYLSLVVVLCVSVISCSCSVVVVCLDVGRSEFRIKSLPRNSIRHTLQQRKRISAII